MLVAIAKNTNIKKVAKYTTKEEGPFICPGCQQDVIFRKGVAIPNFFAHKVATTCAYGAKEKELQRRAKMEIYDGLVEKGYPTELEHQLTTPSGRTHLIDVLVELPQGKLAIELNKFSYSLSELQTYTTDCQSLGITVLWGCFIKGVDIKDRYLPDFVEKFTHTLTCGSVFYWAGGLQFKVCHFLPYVPKNKLLERTYGKYVLRQFHPEKIPLDELCILSTTYKDLGTVTYPALLPLDWYNEKD